jgi:hypothetical protein
MNNQYQRVDEVVSRIREVGLTEAYVSIEVEEVSALVSHLNSQGITTEVTDWPLPENLYVGVAKKPRNLVVVSLNFG